MKHPEQDRAESGLTWGFEIESLVLEILETEELDEIREDDLLDLLFQRKELQPLLARFIEQVQRYPEMAKEFGRKDYSYPKTAREELKSLLEDVTDGPWHEVPEGGFGAHRKLNRWIINHGDTKYSVIRKVEDESKHIKK